MAGLRKAMRGCLGRVARAVACVVAIGCVGVGVSAPAVGQAKQAQPQAKPGEPAKPKPFDVCKGLTGANAPTKVAACTEAINLCRPPRVQQARQEQCAQTRRPGASARPQPKGHAGARGQRPDPPYRHLLLRRLRRRDDAPDREGRAVSLLHARSRRGRARLAARVVRFQ